MNGWIDGWMYTTGITAAVDECTRVSSLLNQLYAYV